MRKLFISLSLLIVSASVCAQGTIQFSTFNSARGVNAPIYAPGQVAVNGAGIGTLGTVNAQLFLVTGSGAAATYTALTPATTFSTANPTAARYVIIPDSNVVVPGVPAGGSATVVLRAWLGESYDMATFRGQTAPVLVQNLGGIPASGGAPLQPAVLAGLQGFEIVPEPSTLAFGLLGAAALLFRRRK